MTAIEDELRAIDRAAGPPPPEHPLITARRVRGTAVFGRPGGRRLGRVRDVALDKRSGCVAYVILARGGLFGVGRRLHAAPWRLLSYDVARGGYMTPCTRRDLQREGGLRAGELGSETPPPRDASLYPTTPRGIGAEAGP